MPIPKEILAVPRPKNTVVIVYGKDKNLFAVRQRVGCKYVNGRHIPMVYGDYFFAEAVGKLLGETLLFWYPNR